MHAEVGRERERAGQLSGRGPRRSPSAADDRERALVEVAERLCAPGRDRRRSRAATWRACWIATVASPGSGFPSGPGCDAASPITEISGWPGRRAVGETSSRPPRSCAAPVASASAPANGAACTPAAQITVAAVDALGRAAVLVGDAVGVDRGGARALAHVDAERRQLAPGLRRQLRAEGGEHALAGVEQHDARVARDRSA